MPALSVILTGNAKPLEAELLRTEAIVAAWGKQLGTATAASQINIKNPFFAAQAAAAAEETARLAASANDAQRYYERMYNYGAEMRNVNRLDNEAWLIKLAAAKGITVETLKAQQAMKALRLETQGAAAATAAANAHLGGFNGVLRESLVIVREILRGNWTRVAGSFTLLVQYLRNIRSELGLVGGLFTATGAAALAAIGGIVAGIFILRYRIRKLTEEMTGLKRVDLPKPDLGAVTAYAKAWMDVKAAIAAANDEVNSANAMFERQKSFLDQRQETERQMLDLQREQAVAKAGNDPARVAQVEAAFNQKSHDLQVRQMKEQETADAQHIAALQKEQDEKLAAGKAIRVMTKEQDQATEEILKKQVEMDDVTQARALFEALEAKKRAAGGIGGQTPVFSRFAGATFTSEDQARMDAAKDKLDQANADKRALDDFQRTKSEREELRTRQQQLFDEAKTAGEDKVKATAAYQQALAMNQQILADDQKLRAMSTQTEATRSRGGGGGRMEVTERERIGAQSAQGISLLNVSKQHLAVSKEILKAVQGGHEGAVGGTHFE
jgi:hypothetical protein